MKDTKNTIYVFNSKSKSLYSGELVNKKLIPIGVLENWVGDDGAEMLSFQYTPIWVTFKDRYPITPILPLRLEAYVNKASHVNFSIFLEHEEGSWFKFLTNKAEEISAKESNREKNALKFTDYISNIQGDLAPGDLFFTDESNKLYELSLDDLVSYVRDILKEGSVDTSTAMLIYSLRGIGGTCPKVSSKDSKDYKDSWIAKFPRKSKGIDLKRRMQAYSLAKVFGLNVPELKLEKDSEGNAYTLLSKRFDRRYDDKIPFATARSILGDKYKIPELSRHSYLELAEFILLKGDPADLEEMWKRMLFNIVIANRDDNLYSHGFLYKNGTWRLSPLFGLKFSRDCRSKENGLGLNINAEENTLDLDVSVEKAMGLAIEVAPFFKVSRDNAKMHIKKLAGIISNNRNKLNDLDSMKIKVIVNLKAYADKLSTSQANLAKAKIVSKTKLIRGDDGRYKKKD